MEPLAANPTLMDHPHRGDLRYRFELTLLRRWHKYPESQNNIRLPAAGLVAVGFSEFGRIGVSSDDRANCLIPATYEYGKSARRRRLSQLHP